MAFCLFFVFFFTLSRFSVFLTTKPMRLSSVTWAKSSVLLLLAVWHVKNHVVSHTVPTSTLCLSGTWCEFIFDFTVFFTHRGSLFHTLGSSTREGLRKGGVVVGEVEGWSPPAPAPTVTSSSSLLKSKSVPDPSTPWKTNPHPPSSNRGRAPLHVSASHNSRHSFYRR